VRSDDPPGQLLLGKFKAINPFPHLILSLQQHNPIKTS
jgi:hypothetical protein